MVDLLMLGQIPGTSIYINFGSWVILALLTASALTVRYDHLHRRRLWLGLVYLSLWWQFRDQTKLFDRIAL